MKKMVTRKIDNVNGIVKDSSTGFMVAYDNGETAEFTTYNAVKKAHSIGKTIDENAELANDENKNKNDGGNEMKIEGTESVTGEEVVIATETTTVENVAKVEEIVTGADVAEVAKTDEVEKTATVEDAAKTDKAQKTEEKEEQKFDIDLAAGGNVLLLSFERTPDRKGNLSRSNMDFILTINNNKYYLDIVNATDGSFALLLLCDDKHEAIYKTPKWSIKDTCSWLGAKENMTTEHVDELAKVITSMRKVLKKQAKDEAKSDVQGAPKTETKTEQPKTETKEEVKDETKE